VALGVRYREDGWGREKLGEESITASALAFWLGGVVWFWRKIPRGTWQLCTDSFCKVGLL